MKHLQYAPLLIGIFLVAFAFGLFFKLYNITYIDNIVQQNLAVPRPYIELCIQFNGVWLWQMDGNNGTIIGKCIPAQSLTKETNGETRSDKSAEVRSGLREVAMGSIAR